MEEKKILLNKKFIILTICLVSLMFISSVSAEGNYTSEIVDVDKTTDNLITVQKTPVIEQIMKK